MKSKFSEDCFTSLTSNYNVRYAQIVISKKRFEYLIDNNGMEIDNFVLYVHREYISDNDKEVCCDGWFTICDKSTMKCLIRAFYRTRPEDENIYAVIGMMHTDYSTLIEKYGDDGFQLVCNLVLGE